MPEGPHFHTSHQSQARASTSLARSWQDRTSLFVGITKIVEMFAGVFALGTLLLHSLLPAVTNRNS